VVLESAKDRILGVDTLGHHVPPCVWYGTTCLLIRYAIGCVSCLVEWELASYFVTYFATYFVIRLNHMVQKGPFAGESIAKHGILL
jgi:fatty-acid desaturase